MILVQEGFRIDPCKGWSVGETDPKLTLADPTTEENFHTGSIWVKHLRPMLIVSNWAWFWWKIPGDVARILPQVLPKFSSWAHKRVQQNWNKAIFSADLGSLRLDYSINFWSWSKLE